MLPVLLHCTEIMLGVLIEVLGFNHFTAPRRILRHGGVSLVVVASVLSRLASLTRRADAGRPLAERHFVPTVAITACDRRVIALPYSDAKAKNYTHEKLRRRLGEIDTAIERAIERRMQITGETQVSLTDADCRAMASSPGGRL